MTTNQVFETIISQRAWYKELGFTASNGNTIANRYREGKLSIDKIEEIIRKAGYSVKQEKTWQK